MKLPLLLALLSLATIARSQDIPQFAKYQVAGTGCHVYLPGDPGEFELSLSEDSSEIYIGEVSHNDFFFAVIAVKFSEPLGTDKLVNEDLTMSYLDFLQEQFGVVAAAGYGTGHTLESAPAAIGVIDYWEDVDGLQYAVKAWCDGNYLAVLLLYGPDQYPHFGAQEMFLNGFRFPE
jgi:hypothetical protein